MKFDYLLVLPPPKSICRLVSSFKIRCSKIIGPFEGMRATAHITVTNYFVKDDYQVDLLVPYLKIWIATLPKLRVNIDGFDFFETDGGRRKTIYAKLMVDEHTRLFLDQLRDIINGNAIVPHITIVKDIPDAKFQQLWPIFKSKEWQDSFMADRVSILKRETFNINSFYTVADDLLFKGHKLSAAYIYKNRRRRITMRGAISGCQMNLFDQISA